MFFLSNFVCEKLDKACLEESFQLAVAAKEKKLSRFFLFFQKRFFAPTQEA
jgi:hypothetical protein